MYRSGHLDKVTWSPPDTWIDLSVARDTYQLWRFWVCILNLLKKQVWTKVEPSHMEPITFSNFNIHHGFSHIWCYSRNFKFPCPDSESPAELSLYKSCSTQFRAGHPTPSSCPYIVLGIAGATGWIGTWDVDILNLLEKQVWVQVKPSKLEGVKFPINKFMLIILILQPKQDRCHNGTTRFGISSKKCSWPYQEWPY